MAGVPKSIYQLRATWLEDPYDIVGHLTHAVWRAVARIDENRSLDPHLWPSLFLAFRDAFKGRLVLYKGCGDHEACPSSTEVFPSESHREERGIQRIYLLQLHTDLDHFMSGLVDVAVRRLRDNFPEGKDERRSLALKIDEAIRAALGPHLYFNQACATCGVRETSAERRLWPHQAKPLDHEGERSSDEAGFSGIIKEANQ